MREVRPPLVELTIARVKEFFREPEAIFWVFAFPLLLALALGFAFRNRAPEKAPAGIVEGPASPDLFRALSVSPGLTVQIFSASSGREALKTGKISLLVEAGPPVTYRFDPTRPDSRAARLEATEALRKARGTADPAAPKEIASLEKGGRYIDFLIPGLLGLNLMGTGMWGIGFSIVNSRIKKLLKLLVASPMRRSDYLLSQIFGRLVFLAFEATALLVFGWAVFGVTVTGSFLLLAIVTLAGALAFSGLGLLVASRAQTIEAATGWMNVVMLPMWLLSGTFFSYARFPKVFQPLIRALPLTAANDALRRVMGGTHSFSAVGTELAILAGWSVVSFALALRIFRWQ